MSTVPLAVSVLPTLADAVDEALAAGLDGDPAPCLWCGSRAVVIAQADLWSGRVLLRCRSCGSELEGHVRRDLMELPA